MKLTCPNCGREHPLREPFPAPGSRIVCACGRRLSVQYPPATLEQLRKRGARFQTEAESALSAGAATAAGVDDEATSLFTASQIEEASRAARTAGGTLVPEAAPPVRPPVRVLPPTPSDLRKIPDHNPTGLFPFSTPGGNAAPPPVLPPRASPAAPLSASAPALVPGPAVPSRPTGAFEEEPTALFMSDGELREASLRDIPDHGLTGMIYPGGGLGSLSEAPPVRAAGGPGVAAPFAPPPPPRPPAPAGPVGVARPVVIEAPNPPRQVFSAGPELSAATFEAPRPPPSASSMEPVASASALPADQAFPESASGVRRGATLDEIMRLKVQDRSADRPVWDKVPRVALALLVLLGLGAALFIVVAVALLVTR